MYNAPLFILQAGGDGFMPDTHTWLFVILPLALFTFLIWYWFFARPITERNSRCVRLDGHHISAEEMFKRIKSRIEERKLPIKMKMGSMFENGVLSSRREYLRIQYLNFMVDVSSGFFGDSSYISWHVMVQQPSVFVKRFPAMSAFGGASPDFQSYYRVDTKSTFLGIVLDTIDEEIDAFAETNGMRPMGGEDGMHGTRKPTPQLA